MVDRSGFLLQFISDQLYALARNLHDQSPHLYQCKVNEYTRVRHRADIIAVYGRMGYRVWKLQRYLEKLMVGHLGEDIAKGLELRDICIFISMYYNKYSDFQSFTHDLLDKIGRRRIKQVIATSSEQEADELIDLLGDYRLPSKFLRSALEEAKRLGLKSDRITCSWRLLSELESWES